MGFQVPQVFTEVEGACQAESVNGPGSVLAQIHFIEVCFQDFVFIEIHFHGNGHKHLIQFALKGFCTGQEKILCQLLAEGARALNCVTFSNVDHQGPQDCQGFNAMMGVKCSVLYGDKGLGQKWGRCL